MLKAADAGRLLGLSARTMYALAAAGKIACHRMGVGDAAIRFDEADVLAYKESCRSPVTTQAVGCSSLTASSPEPEDSALTSFFRRAGRKPKPTNTTKGKRRGSGMLQLVESSQSR